MKTNKITWKCGVLGMMMLCGLATSGAKECCPLPYPPKPPGGPNGGANDPVFFYTETKPAQSERARFAELRQQVKAKVAAAGEREQAALARYEEVRKSDANAIMGVVDEVWAAEVSPELKQYVLVASLTAVKSTEAMEKLRFMLEAMKEPAVQAKAVAILARGNGLEKAKAAGMMDILSKNPQIKL